METDRLDKGATVEITKGKYKGCSGEILSFHKIFYPNGSYMVAVVVEERTEILTDFKRSELCEVSGG